MLRLDANSLWVMCGLLKMVDSILPDVVCLRIEITLISVSLNTLDLKYLLYRPSWRALSRPPLTSRPR